MQKILVMAKQAKHKFLRKQNTKGEKIWGTICDANKIKGTENSVSSSGIDKSPEKDNFY